MKHQGIYRLCLVTDDTLLAGRDLAAVVMAAVEGGVTMVQVREKLRPTRAFLADARALHALLRPRGIPLIVNDRIDVALAIGAEGVHVGQDDMPVETVRRLVGPDMLIGLSITGAAAMAQPDAAQADYFGVGPIFAQATKPDAAPPLGLDGLAGLRALTGKPVVAIGGVGVTNAADVMRAGADGVAVVSAILSAANPRAAAAAMRRAIEAHPTGRERPSQA